MYKLILTVTLGVVAVLAAPARGSAQAAEYLIGRPTTAVNLPVEEGFINVQNGNLHIEIPFASYNGRGDLSTSFEMVYDSMIWHGVAVGEGGYQWQPNNVPNANGGWRFVSSLAGLIGGSSDELICGSEVVREGPFFINMLDGTQHSFPITTISNPAPSSSCTATDYPDTPTGTGYAIDGSGYYAVVSNYNDIAVYDQSGTKIYDAATGMYPVDRNGNYVDPTHDDLGRTLGPTTTTSPDGTITYYTFPTTNGQTEQFTVTTETIQLNTNFLSDSVGTDYQGPMTVVKSIGLPDGSSYGFTYEDGTYGELSGITLPQGGAVSYIYQSGLNGTRAGETVPPRWVSSHTGSNGTTSFSILPSNCPNGVGQIGPCPTQDNYVTRNGIVTDYNFGLKDSNGYFNNYIYYHSGDKNSTVVRTVAKTYNLDGLCPVGVCQGQAMYLYPNLATVADVFNDTLMTTYTSYTYGTPGVATPTKVMQWDYYTSSASSSPAYAPTGGPTRETDTTLGENVNGALLPTVVTTSDASGALSQTTLQYDDPGQTTPAAASVPYHNDSLVTGNRGNLTAISRILLPSTKVTTLLYYDTAGALKSTKDPLLNTTTYGYDATDAFVTSITQPTTGNVQHVTHAMYDASTGQILTQSDQNSQMTQYSYDSYGRMHTVTAPSGAVTTWLYPSATETDVTDMQSASVTVPSSTIVDGFGRPSQATTSGTSSETTYDAYGRVNCVTTPHTATAAPTDGSTCNTLYDQFDRVQTVTDPDSSTATLSYTDNQVTATDEVGHKRQYTYNAFGNLISVIEQNNLGTLAWETDYTYDGLNRLRAVNQKGDASTSAGWRTRTFNYDSLSRLSSQTTPEGGTITFNNYDGNDNLLLSTDARGQAVQYQYDVLNRLTGKTVQSGGNYVYYVYYYDATQNNDQYGIGRLNSMFTNANLGVFFFHDASGNVIQELYCLPNDCSYNHSTSATYDYHGNIVSLTYPDGRSIYQGYDTLDRLIGSGENRFLTETAAASSKVGVQPLFSRPRPYLSEASYFPAGELNTAVYGNVIQMTAAFNNRQNITSLSYSESAPVWAKSYSWDHNAQNLLSVTDQITGVARSFTYDHVNRLISAADSAGGYSDSYTIDAWGNRQESGTFNFGQPFSATNQISATGYTYDIAGNLTADGLGNTYSYDSDGKMSASNSAVYTLDPFGQRVLKNYAGNSTEYFFFGGQLMATLDPASSAWTDYIYAAGQLIAESPSGTQDTTLYHIGDHLGSLVAKIDNLGNLQGTNDVSAFGELISNTAPDLLLFTQHERDAENDSDETLYRQYASAQGRWLSPDPSNGSYDLTDPQSLNRYAYLSGRPLSGVDRFGLQDDDPSPGNDGDGIGGVISTIFVAAIDFFSNFFGGNSVNPALAHSTVNTSIESSYNPNVPTFYVNSYAGVGAGESFGVFPAAYTFYVTAAASGGAPSNKQITGVGRGLAGNTRLVGRQGGIPGQTVQLNTAADPRLAQPEAIAFLLSELIWQRERFKPFNRCEAGNPSWCAVRRRPAPRIQYLSP